MNKMMQKVFNVKYKMNEGAPGGRKKSISNEKKTFSHFFNKAFK